ncbi:MAG: hypothetical protein ABR597_15045, partial [Bacteroidales bacterium]
TDLDDRNTLENSNLAFINLQVPFQLSDNINVSFEFGGRYSAIERSRFVSTLSQAFYYLGGAYVKEAAESYDDELIYIPSNPSLISIQNFEDSNKEIGVELE